MQLFSEVEGEESNTDMYTFMPTTFEFQSYTTIYSFKKQQK